MTTTLSDFLLARIAEDEASLPTGHDCWYEPERYAVECEAKRRIVDLHQADAREDGEKCSVCAQWAEDWPCRTLQAIAVPYAGHQDFDEEWISGRG